MMLHDKRFCITVDLDIWHRRPVAPLAVLKSILDQPNRSAFCTVIAICHQLVVQPSAFVHTRCQSCPYCAVLHLLQDPSPTKFCRSLSFAFLSSWPECNMRLQPAFVYSPAELASPSVIPPPLLPSSLKEEAPLASSSALRLHSH